MYPHRIRLRGPWQCEPVAWTEIDADGRIVDVSYSLPEPRIVTLPCRWSEAGLQEFAGRVRFRRRFQWPNPLPSNERLWLVFHAADYFSRIWLNGCPLGHHAGAFDPFRFDVTDLVVNLNELVVEVDCPDPAQETHGRVPMLRGRLGRGGGLWGPVNLEVRSHAWFEDLALVAHATDSGGRLAVEGSVYCEQPEPLELDLLLDGTRVLYRPLAPRAGRQSLLLEAEAPHVVRWRPGQPHLYEVRLELTRGAVILDSQMWMTGFRETGPTGQATVPRLDLVEPISSPRRIEQADRAGALVRLVLPSAAGTFSDDASFIKDVVRQTKAIVRGLRHHPAIGSWQCFDADQEIGFRVQNAVRNAVAQADPSPGRMIL